MNFLFNPDNQAVIISTKVERMEGFRKPFLLEQNRINAFMNHPIIKNGFNRTTMFDTKLVVLGSVGVVGIFIFKESEVLEAIRKLSRNEKISY